MKAFYANLEERLEDRVFVRGKWVDVSSEAINNLIGAPKHNKDDYTMLMEEGQETNVLVQTLCSPDREVIWATGKTNRHVNFNVGALQPKWIPLFKLICCRLIPIKNTSHVTLDRAVLLYAMVQKRKVDTGWIILNNMIDSMKLSKAL